MRTMRRRAVEMMRAGACQIFQRSRFGLAVANGPLRHSIWNHDTEVCCPAHGLEPYLVGLERREREPFKS